MRAVLADFQEIYIWGERQTDQAE